MRNNIGGRGDRESNRTPSNRNSDARSNGRSGGKRDYSSEMLFDDNDDYDDDADYDSYDTVKRPEDDYSDSAFGPDADYDDADDSDWRDNTAATDDGSADDEYEDTEDWQDMKDKIRKKKNRVWGIILAIEIVAAIVIGVLFVKAYINNTYNKMQYNEPTSMRISMRNLSRR